MGQLVAILVATAMMGLIAPPMVELALMPARTSRQKSNFSLAESNAIAVRKQAAKVNRDDIDGLTRPAGCKLEQGEIPAGHNTVVDYFV
ncbi:hypothetical protein VB716_07680 [Synechococcus sp. CCY9201]|uniref:hypothetical protein n=1 Tax=Synechococcus sp. CCY9201 TaxID=174697 RepID=UPI002B1ECCA3|nr:hypothetical protein [Synechococcus sp. CCY9201]MEA5474102.1 hypothetical protein [Synechococcus sp. CCY9201]